MEGYAKVAMLMATDENYGILRRFKQLNYQSLLYRQAEILHLKEELDELVRRDARYEDRKDYVKDWWSLAHGNDSEGGQDQWKKTCQLCQKLDEYNDRLLKQTQLAKLEAPAKVNLKELREWFSREDLGCYPLLGTNMTAWDPDVQGDLATMKPPVTSDLISKWINTTVLLVYHRLIGVHFKEPAAPELGGAYIYEESLLATTVNITTTVVASIMPLLSIVVLFFVQSNIHKIGIIVAFSALFSFALSIMTNARRIEIFGATAAFAAVNVVFLTATTPDT